MQLAVTALVVVGDGQEVVAGGAAAGAGDGSRGRGLGGIPRMEGSVQHSPRAPTRRSPKWGNSSSPCLTSASGADHVERHDAGWLRAHFP